MVQGLPSACSTAEAARAGKSRAQRQQTIGTRESQAQALLTPDTQSDRAQCGEALRLVTPPPGALVTLSAWEGNLCLFWGDTGPVLLLSC